TRSGYRTVLAFAQRGIGERFAYNLGRLKVRWLGDEATPSTESDGRLLMVQARLAQGFIAPQFHLAVIPEQRLFQRRRGERSTGSGTRPRRGLRAVAELGPGGIVV